MRRGASFANVPHIIVTGPESTGKTTLARELAAHYGGVFVPEYARGFLGAVSRPARTSDFGHFVAAQDGLHAAAAAQLQRRGQPLAAGGTIVQDTGAEVLKLWHEDKFGACPPAVTEAFERQSADVYLLCRPDLPWEYDPLREDPHRRGELFTRLRRLLDEGGKRTVEVRGSGKARKAGIVDKLRGLGLA